MTVSTYSVSISMSRPGCRRYRIVSCSLSRFVERLETVVTGVFDLDLLTADQFQFELGRVAVFVVLVFESRLPKAGVIEQVERPIAMFVVHDRRIAPAHLYVAFAPSPV